MHTAKAQDEVGPFEYEISTDVLTASLRGTWPIGRFSFSGKLGYAFYDSDQSIRIATTSASSSHRDSDLAGSVAAGFHFTPRISMRIEYEGILLENGKFEDLSLIGIYRF